MWGGVRDSGGAVRNSGGGAKGEVGGGIVRYSGGAKGEVGGGRQGRAVRKRQFGKGGVQCGGIQVVERQL